MAEITKKRQEKVRDAIEATFFFIGCAGFCLTIFCCAASIILGFVAVFRQHPEHLMPVIEAICNIGKWITIGTGLTWFVLLLYCVLSPPGAGAQKSP